MIGDPSMQNKVALITGCSKGIGKRIAVDLARKGFHLILNYRNNSEQIKVLSQKFQAEYGVKTLCIQGDVSSYEDSQRIVSQALDYFNRIDILINNAGPFIYEYKSLAEYTYEEWHQMMDGNLSSVFYMVKQVLPIMKKNSWGRIVNFGFNLAETAPAWVHRSAYATAKVGLVSLTKTLALEEAHYGITVNMICPGDIIQPWKEANILQVRNALNNSTPVGRTGSGQDISRVISFLCENDSDFITGAIIPVTGGKTSFV
jgi:3-oxoacyl-[acyl-carrier protein] reductase